MTPEQIQRRLYREKQARVQAEQLLEQKSRDLYAANRALEASARNLELQVTERTQDLELALEKLHSASRAKDDFLATISHEIRTPLNAMLGAVGLLKDSDLDRTQRHYLELGERAGYVLLEQINHILDYVRLQDINQESELETQTAANLLDQVVYAVAAKAHAKGLRVFGSMDPEADIEVIVDSAKARQVVLNFLDNAIKFTPSGWVWFHVSASEVDREHVQIMCEVTDTGYGLPDDPARLFLPFERNDNLREETRAIEGTGLGLSISKKIVDGFEGDIGAEPSPYGKGSRFWCVSDVLINRDFQPTQPGPGEFRDTHVIVLTDGQNAPWLTQVFDKWQVSYECVGALSDRVVGMAEKRATRVYILEIGRHAQSERKRYPDLKHVVLCANEKDAEQMDPSLTPFVALTSSELLEGLKSGFQIEEGHGTGTELGQCQGRLLLVEDSYANQIITAAMLTRQGYIVDTASNGQEAVDAAACLPYDLILMDIQMPVMDGLDAATIIQSDSSINPKPPIIALTASVSDQVRRQCDQIGICEILPKPVVPESLFRTVGKWCKSQPDSMTQMPPVLSAAQIHKPTVAEMARNTPEGMMQNLLQIFIDEVGERLLDCRNAVSCNDLEAISRQAHALKSAAGTYGVKAVSALAAELEGLAVDGNRADTERLLSKIEQTWDLVRHDLGDAYEAAERARKQS